MRPTLKLVFATLGLLAAMGFLACKGGGSSSTSTPAPTAPTISGQPANQTVVAGAAASFGVTATGTAPLTYQWTKGGVAISGANASTYTTPATLLTDTGAAFTVTVSNSVGSVTSSAAILTVQPTATGLNYTDPAASGYYLKKNTTLSTASHLVLDLMGPTTGTGIGVSLKLSADATKVSWANVAAPDGVSTVPFVQNGAAFNLGSGTPILKGTVSGNLLQATVAQKGAAAASLNASLLRVALDLKATVALAPGTVLPLTADATKCQVLTDIASAPTLIQVTVGTLAAQ